MSEPLSERSKKASVGAMFDLAGGSLVKKFDSKTQLFLPATLNFAPLGTLMDQDSYGSLKEYNNAIRYFNETLYEVGDAMPSASSVFYSGGGNRRAANLTTFLQSVDVGANPNQRYKAQYDAARSKFDAAQKDYNKGLQAAVTEWDKSHPDQSAETEQFQEWLKLTYSGRRQMSVLEQDLINAQSLWESAGTLYYGPLAQVRDNWKLSANKGQEKSFEIPRYNMEMSTAKTYNPFYFTNLQGYATWWTGVVNGTFEPGKYAASADFKMSADTQYNFEQYGFTESEINGDSFIGAPFLFWGNTRSKTTKEEWQEYFLNDVQTAEITVGSWAQPLLLPVAPGDWWRSDPLLTFTKHQEDLDALIYPYISQIAVTYGLGYKIKLSQTTFSSLYNHVYQKTEKRHVAFFGFFFEIDGAYSSTDIMKNDTSEVLFDENTSTVEIAPLDGGYPVLLGVVCNKKPLDEALLEDTSTAIVPRVTGTVVPSTTYEPVMDFLDSMSRCIDSLPAEALYRLESRVKATLSKNKLFPDLLSGLDEIIATTGKQKRNGETERNEITIEQKNGKTTTCITIRSFALTEHDDRVNGSISYQDEVHDAATALVPMLSSQAGETPQSKKAAHLLCLGLASLTGLTLDLLPTNAGKIARSIVSRIAPKADRMELLGWEKVFRDVLIEKSPQLPQWTLPSAYTFQQPMGANVRLRGLIALNINPGDITRVFIYWKTLEGREQEQIVASPSWSGNVAEIYFESPEDRVNPTRTAWRTFDILITGLKPSAGGEFKLEVSN